MFQYRILFLILISILQTSCGFRSLYSTFHSYSIPSISLQSIDSAEGAELYQVLVEILGKQDKAKYELQITLEYNISSLAITSDSSTIIQSVAQTAKYYLYDSVSGMLITSGAINSFGVCSTMLTAYNSYVEEAQTKIHLAKEAANAIYGRLLMYFANDKNTLR